MKKTVVLCAALVAALGVGAQESGQGKRWSIIPRVGVNFSNLGDMDVYHGNNDGKTTPRTMTDFMAGAEFDYLVTPEVEVGVGAYYSRQGCHYKNYYDQYTTSDPDVMRVEGVENNNIHLQYLNIPVVGKYHFNENVALKAGVQCGVFLSGNWVEDITTMNVNTKSGKQDDVTSTHLDNDTEWFCAKTVWSIPVGLEFEYEKVIIGVDYAIPVTGFGKDVEWVYTANGTSSAGGSGSSKMSKGSNHVVTMTIGYRF